MVNKKMLELGQNRSAIRELFEYGSQKKKELGADKVFDFSLGNPSISSPKEVNETLVTLINNTNPTSLHAYTTAAGLFEVREAIAKYLNQTYLASVDPKLMYLTVGAAAALTATFNAITKDKSDEIVVIAPFFPEYQVFVEKAGATLKIAKADDVTLKINYQNLNNVIKSKTIAVVIDYPNNPTGVVLNSDEIKELSDFLRIKEKEVGHPIYLISDEPYRELIYEDIQYPFITNYYDDSIVCYSFSKCISLPGERIGYVLVNPKCLDATLVYDAIAGAARSLGFVCASALFQRMIPYILGKTSDLSVYKKNRDVLYQALIKLGYDVVFPSGAFYMFVKALEPDAEAFSNHAKEKYNLLLVPSNSFGFNGFVRISYCVSLDTIERSLELFKQLKEDYK